MIIEILGSFVIFFVILFAVSNIDQLSVPIITLMVTYALQIIPHLNSLVRFTSSLENNILSVERIVEDTKKDAEEDGTSQIEKKDDWPSKGKIEYINFSLKYNEDDENVLKNINVCFENGTKTSVIGRTGAGKTSLVLSLFRLFFFR